jgi:hypothetical protein
MTIHPALESHPGSALLAPAHAQYHKDQLQGSRRWRDKGGHPHQIAVIASVESRRWIAAHDALQQHSTRKLQTPPFEETLGGHHLAPQHSVQVRCYTLNPINARQPLRKGAVVINRHDSKSFIFVQAVQRQLVQNTHHPFEISSTATKNELEGCWHLTYIGGLGGHSGASRSADSGATQNTPKPGRCATKGVFSTVEFPRASQASTFRLKSFSAFA